MHGSRPGYIAQVGLDFGTAFSKCVVRDIGRGNARVLENYTSSRVPGSPFLFPSLLAVQDGLVVTDHPDCGQALPFAKMVLTTLAKGRGEFAPLGLWHDYLQILPAGMGEVEGITLAAAWLLAPLLKQARELATVMMPNFGEQTDDYLLVNLCIPVDDMTQKEVISSFR